MEERDDTYNCFTLLNSYIEPEPQVLLPPPAVTQLQESIQIIDNSQSRISLYPSELIGDSLMELPFENKNSQLRKTISRNEIENDKHILAKSIVKIQQEYSYLSISDWLYIKSNNFIQIEKTFLEQANSKNKESYKRLIDSVKKCNLNLVHKKPELIYNVSPLSTIEYLIEESITFEENKKHHMVSHLLKLEEHVYKWRHIRGDGNCFYRAIIFAFLENIVITNNLYLLKEFAIGFYDKINTINSSIKNSRYLLNHIKSINTIISIEMLHLLIEYLEQDQVSMCYETLIKAFSFCPAFDLAMIFYFKYLLYEFLKGNQNKLYNNDFSVPLGNLLPDKYQLDDNSFDFELFYEEQLFEFGKDAEKIVVYITPFVLKCDVKVIIYDFESNKDDCLYVKEFKCGLNGKIQIEVLFKKTHYELTYSKEYFEQYQNLLSLYTNLNEKIKVLDSCFVEAVHKLIKDNPNADPYAVVLEINERNHNKLNEKKPQIEEPKKENNKNNNKTCNLCPSKINNSINIPLCGNCVETILKTEMPSNYKKYLNLVYNSYKTNQNINFKLSFEAFFSNLAILLYDVKQHVQNLTTLTRYSLMNYIEEAKKRICLFCLKDIKDFNGVIKLTCSCYFCSQNCFVKFYDFFLIEDYERKLREKFKKPIFTSCPCGYPYTFNDYKNLYLNLDESMKDYLKKILRDIWVTLCANCGKCIDDKKYLTFEFKSKLLSVFHMKNAQHSICNQCEKLFPKEVKFVECKLCKEKHEMHKIKQINSN